LLNLKLTGNISGYHDNKKWRCYLGSRDFQRKEKKKSKKESKKNPVVTSFEAPRPEVEVIRKGKKTKELEEE
jgi:hypothetical protein